MGQLWSEFVADFYRAAPAFAEFEDEVHTAYYTGSLDSPGEPYRQIAKGAYVLALEFGRRFRIANADTRAAEVWLADNFRAEFRLLDEFVPQPTHTSKPRLPAVPLE